MAQIRAYLDGEQVVVWTDGDITGDPRYVSDFLREDADRITYRLGPPEGPFSEGDHLTTALGFCLLASIVLPEDVSLHGDVPNERDMKDDDGNWIL